MIDKTPNDKIQKLNIYDALILSANGGQALYVHNRKFYWNAIENYFEPIYYDGEFNILDIYFFNSL